MKYNPDRHLELSEPQKKALEALAHCVSKELKKYGDDSIDQFLKTSLKDCYYQVKEDELYDLGSIEMVKWFHDSVKETI